MSKSRICTFAMFLLAICIIFGGWFLTERLLVKHEVNFLDSTGRIEVRSEEIKLFAENEQENTGEQLTQQEEFYGHEMNAYTRAKVLSVWDYGGKELPHEPMTGQMNMEQAIDAGKKWVETMAASGFFTDKLQGCEFDATKATLCTIDTPRRYTDMEEMLYSYWKLWFVKDGVSVELMLHAASGEVWKAKFTVEIGDEPVATYDLAYLLSFAFPFMEIEQESDYDVIWSTVGEDGVDAVSIEGQMLSALAKQYLLQINEEPTCVGLDFGLKAK
ncbi:MAG: hypothetical protein K2L82_07935 [Lachnospiraceae bacterium]|nr:hypothetical protein [Lachnospiraceae bacterium]